MAISSKIFNKEVITKPLPEAVSLFTDAGARRMWIFPEVSEALDKAKKAKELKELERIALEIYQFMEEGDTKFKTGDYLEAEKACNKAYKTSLKTDNKALQSLCLCFVGTAIGVQQRFEEALLSFGKALELEPENALAWLGKGCVLMGLEQYEEASKSFERALPLREKLLGKGTALFAPQAQLALILGVESIFSRDMRKAEERALEFIRLRKEAEKEGMTQAVEEAVAEVKTALTEEGVKPFAEFEEMVTLVAIEDPFELWKVLRDRISEKWPKGVSAVEAIREQRK